VRIGGAPGPCVACSVLAGLALLTTSGCPTPCTVDEDCADLWGCIDGVCAQNCVNNDDCSVGFQCNGHGSCVENATGTIRWEEPAPDSEVADRFDGAVRVSFRGPSARVRVVRDLRRPGDACAPVAPFELRVEGDPEETFEQRVELPGLFAAGERFSLVATLEAAGGFIGDTLPLRGPAIPSSTLSITSPPEGDVAGEPVWLDVSTNGASGAQSAAVRTAPEQGAAGVSLTLDPQELGSVMVPVARGAQSVYVEGTDPDGAPFSCGRAFSVAETGEGLELALWFQASEGEALVRMRVLVEEGGSEVVCTALEPLGPCVTVRELGALAARGDEIVSLAGTTDASVRVAVTPAAISAPVRAGVRVSYEGRHVAFLGPFSLNPALGEVWIAGDITLAGGVPLVTPRFEISPGAPF
jgi:hypothetical protein